MTDDRAPRRLNIGCGPVQPEDWVNADPDADGAVYVNPPALPLPWPDATFDYALANHVLQAVAWPDMVGWLAEVRRVLVPGGTLRVLVPDLLRAVAAYLEGDADHFQVADEHERSIDGKLCMYVTQAGATRSVFTEGWLRELAHRAGYAKAYLAAAGVSHTFTAICDLDSRPAESLIMELVAPA